jgi:glutaminase
MKYIGCEPSGARFNSFSLTEENKPFNPFVNTGAIMTCSLIQQGKDSSEKFAHVQNKFSELAGGAKIGFSNSIFLSERNTADRNRALTYFMVTLHRMNLIL